MRCPICKLPINDYSIFCPECKSFLYDDRLLNEKNFRTENLRSPVKMTIAYLDPDSNSEVFKTGFVYAQNNNFLILCLTDCEKELSWVSRIHFIAIPQQLITQGIKH